MVLGQCSGLLLLTVNRLGTFEGDLYCIELDDEGVPAVTVDDLAFVLGIKTGSALAGVGRALFGSSSGISISIDVGAVVNPLVGGPFDVLLNFVWSSGKAGVLWL